MTATTALGQIERAVNRIYGVERDRPALEKYGRAFVHALSVGFLVAVAFMLLAFGRHAPQGSLRLRWPTLSRRRRVT